MYSLKQSSNAISGPIPDEHDLTTSLNLSRWAEVSRLKWQQSRLSEYPPRHREKERKREGVGECTVQCMSEAVWCGVVHCRRYGAVSSIQC